jgi:hypothetical protein
MTDGRECTIAAPPFMATQKLTAPPKTSRRITFHLGRDVVDAFEMKVIRELPLRSFLSRHGNARFRSLALGACAEVTRDKTPSTIAYIARFL